MRGVTNTGQKSLVLKNYHNSSFQAHSNSKWIFFKRKIKFTGDICPQEFVIPYENVFCVPPIFITNVHVLKILTRKKMCTGHAWWGLNILNPNHWIKFQKLKWKTFTWCEDLKVKITWSVVCILSSNQKVLWLSQTEFFARQCPKSFTPDHSFSQPVERK